MSSRETLLNNRYRLVAQQGSGGMAVIYKAIDQALDRTVAVKILRPSLITDPSFLKRFQAEARSVANLAHPNIVTVHDVGKDGNTHYIVMEFLEGQDLKKLIRAEAPFTIDRALHIAIQVCAGVGYAHRAGLVHADVKPQNILVADENDLVKVTDFGIAQALSDAAQGERQKIVWGSPHYFSPEQAQGERPSPASDVYSVGIVLFEMLAGRLPYVGADQQELALAHIREPIPRVTDFNPAVPPPLEQVIMKVMAKEPASRYRTADQLGRILINFRKQGYEATGGIDRRINRQPGPAPSARPVSPPPPAAIDDAATTQATQPAGQSGGQSGGSTTPANASPVVQRPVPSPQQFYQQQTPPPQALSQTPYPRPAPDYARGPVTPPEEIETVFTPVTYVLAVVAFLAVLGVVLLGLEVLSAWVF